MGKPSLLQCRNYKNRTARIVTSSDRQHLPMPLIEKLNWPTIVEIIKRETATMVYKFLNGLAPTYLSNIFSRNATRDAVYLRNSETGL